MSPKEREPLAGGSLGKLAGRAKEMAGNRLGRRKLGRGRREAGVAAVDTSAEDEAAGSGSSLKREADHAEAAAGRIDPGEES